MVEEDAGYAGLTDTLVDLRVDDHPRPIEELQRLYGIHQALFGHTPREEWVEVDAVLAAELRERLRNWGTDEELPAAVRALVRQREPGRAGRRRRADRPGVFRALREA